MSRGPELFVKSHVARDLLQSAALFKNERVVVWEYVSNGLQYIDPGTKPEVRVEIDVKRKRIGISDNGRGMDWEGLQNFFVMHGENQDRKRGKAGRGRFGTGKSAAFGIAQQLTITTVREGKRSKVSLHRRDVEKVRSEQPIPVKGLEREVPCEAPNGTTVEIEGIQLQDLEPKKVIQYIERHLARWARGVSVWVNRHRCEYRDPPIRLEQRIRAKGQQKLLLGNVELVLKVSKTPLEESLQGIAIYANGVWYETTLAGSERREMAQFIFGELDVPKLDQDKSPISPFDQSRNMQLNPANALVQAINYFIHKHVEQLRKQLLAEEQQRRADEEARKLAVQGNAIAYLLNQDFRDFRQQIARANASGAGETDFGIEPLSGGALEEGQETDLIFGDKLPAEIANPQGDAEGQGNGKEPWNSEIPPDFVPQVNPDNGTKLQGRLTGHQQQRNPRGGFRVEFRNMGLESERAEYRAAERSIYINLDHPQLVAARGTGSIEEILFQRLALEIAICEYSIALTQEMISMNYFLDLTEPLFEIRDTINRLTRKGAQLYST